LVLHPTVEIHLKHLKARSTTLEYHHQLLAENKPISV